MLTSYNLPMSEMIEGEITFENNEKQNWRISINGNHLQYFLKKANI